MENDSDLHKEAMRKAWGSKSRSTGKRVAQSQEQLTIPICHGVLQGNVTFNAPPQLREDRVHQLALFQLRAFFYWLTFNVETQQGHWWRGLLCPADGAMKADFGNAVQLAFARRVVTWEYRLLAITADGYFQTAIRKHPTADAWSFALAWNDNYRLVGFFGDVGACTAELDSFPKLHPDRVYSDGPRGYAIRYDIPLSDDDDLLFKPGVAAL